MGEEICTGEEGGGVRGGRRGRKKEGGSHVDGQRELGRVS